MRTLERIIEIIPTINPVLYPRAYGIFNQWLGCVKETGRMPGCDVCVGNIASTAAFHPAPYIRDLARDLLHRLAEIGNVPQVETMH